MRDDRERLLDILESIEQIERYVSQGKDKFENDELIQTWADWNWNSFAGYIDEVRISKIPRYNIKDQLIPNGRFELDANTIALWHFDEDIGSTIFLDSSGHDRSLVGENGVAIGDVFTVNEHNKLASTWGRIKIF